VSQKLTINTKLIVTNSSFF